LPGNKSKRDRKERIYARDGNTVGEAGALNAIKASRAAMLIPAEIASAPTPSQSIRSPKMSGEAA
jgi:hypothetical protein